MFKGLLAETVDNIISFRFSLHCARITAASVESEIERERKEKAGAYKEQGKNMPAEI